MRFLGHCVEQSSKGISMQKNKSAEALQKTQAFYVFFPVEGISMQNKNPRKLRRSSAEGSRALLVVLPRKGNHCKLEIPRKLRGSCVAQTPCLPDLLLKFRGSSAEALRKLRGSSETYFPLLGFRGRSMEGSSVLGALPRKGNEGRLEGIWRGVEGFEGFAVSAIC